MGTFYVSVRMVVEAKNIEDAYQIGEDAASFLNTDFEPETGYVEETLLGEVEADDSNI